MRQAHISGTASRTIAGFDRDRGCGQIRDHSPTAKMTMIRPPAVVLAACFIPSILPAQVPADAASRLDRVFARWNLPQSPGCAVGVAQAGQPLLTRAYGMADLEHAIKNSPETIFEAGSVAKQFTSGAVVLLSLDGKLSLDDPVRKYVPEVPYYGTPITIRHLMTHTSGLRDWGSVAGITGWPRGARVHTHAHMLDIVSRQRALNFPPGAEYSYSNTGYNLLAVIVDRVSGMPFAQFTRQRIFEPLGMKNTQWRDDYTRIVKGRAQAYSTRQGGFALDMPFENVHGNGGLLTTVADLLIWTENLQSGKLGGPAFLEAMHRPGVLSNGREITYASGLMIGTYNNTREVSHTGSTAGYRAFLGRYPEKGLATAVLCNVGNANPGQLGGQIAAIYLGQQRAQPAPALKAASTPAADHTGKAGLYRHWRSNNVLAVTSSDGKLRVAETELVPLSATLFQMGNRQAFFEPAPNGGRPRVRVTTAEGDTTFYEPTGAFTPTAAQLAEFAGEYYSPDAEVTFSAVIDNGALVLLRKPNTRIALTPLYTDAFQSQLGVIRFHRGANGQITELGISQARVYDLRATRQR
jgi:CubicO group peptidase (beta-lactamase class C family)